MCVSRDFPHSFSITPPLNPRHAMGSLLKVNGPEGRQASTVTLPVGVAVGQCYFIKTNDFYTFNVIFSNIRVVLYF